MSIGVHDLDGILERVPTEDLLELSFEAAINNSSHGMQRDVFRNDASVRWVIQTQRPAKYMPPQVLRISRHLR